MRYTLPKTQFVGQNMIYEATCASTNTWAIQCLEQGVLPEGTLVITDHQYQGRGQRGNAWYSEPHKNLTFSVVLYPTFLAASQSFSLNLIATLALHQVLKVYLPNDLTIKWPNDIYYQDQKLSGILIENFVTKGHLKASVIGIGLNVNQEYFQEQGPTSLKLTCKYTFDLPSLLTQLLASLERAYLQLQTQGIAPLKITYLENMYWINQVHTFQDTTHTFQGTIRGIDVVGKLVVEQADGALKHYGFQEVTFVA